MFDSSILFPRVCWRYADVALLGGLDRQSPDAATGCGEDCVCDRRSDDCRRRFTESAWLSGAWHDVSLDTRGLIDAHGYITVEIGLLDASVLERNRPAQRRGQAEY